MQKHKSMQILWIARPNVLDKLPKPQAAKAAQHVPDKAYGHHCPS
jgi:hypothetical protein